METITKSDKTDNELIDEFYVSQGGSPSAKADIDFYYSDWGMIMNVVRKIDQLWDKHCAGNPIQFVNNEEPPFDFHYMEVIALPLSTPINEVRDKILQFIKWHNANSQTP